jgi:hypothetical protein
MDNEFFISRDKELNELREHFYRFRGEPILITGVGGIGKTTLLRFYISRFKNEYDNIIDISFRSLNSKNSLKPYLVSLLDRKINSNKLTNYKIGELLKDKLGNKKSLIIFDDFDFISDYENQEDLLNELIKLNRKNKNYDIIISSRNILSDNFLHGISLSNFNLEQSLSFLHKLLGTKIDNSVLRIIRDTLLTSLNGNPLLLHMAFNFFLKSNDVGSLIQQIEQSLINMFDTIGIELENGVLKPTLLKVEDTSRIIYPNNQLTYTTPYIIIPQVNHYWRKALDEFEKLINSTETREIDIQRFFEINSGFLKGIDYNQVISQPILSQSNGDMTPDFLLCPHDKLFGDIFELKLPSHNLISGRNNRIKFSSAVENAIAQTRHYREFFNSEENRNKVLKKYGLTAYKPKITILLGKTPSVIPDEKLMDLKDYELRDKIEIITYDDFFEKMKRLAKFK